MNSAVKNFVVKVNGNVDVASSKELFMRHLNDFNDSRNVLRTKASKSLNEVFDQHLGKGIKIQMLTDLALQRTSVHPDNFEEMSEAIDDYIHTSNEFEIRKGKGGGVYRKKDLPTT